MVIIADVTDHNGVVEMMGYYCDVTNNLSLVKKSWWMAVMLYGGILCKYHKIPYLGRVEVAKPKRNELHTFAVVPKCWVVERSFGWLHNCCRLWKNCERDMQNSFKMVVMLLFVYS